MNELQMAMLYTLRGGVVLLVIGYVAWKLQDKLPKVIKDKLL